MDFVWTKPVLFCLLLALLLVCLSGCTTVPQSQLEGGTGHSVTRGLLGGDQASEVQLMLTRAEAFYISKQYGEATAAYERLLKLDPQNSQALYRMGNIAFRQQQWEQAQAFYKQVIALDARHSRAHYNLAMTQLALAEKHLQFFAATTDQDADMTLVSQIIGFLNGISQGPHARERDALNNIADQLLRP